MKLEQEALLIRKELEYIGRYLESISPKLSKYQELKDRQVKLRKRLKEIGLSQPGTDPVPFKKKPTNYRDIIIPIEDPKKGKRSVHPLTHRSY
jgi:hypothetical protein